jgi:hypothetical protein
VCFGGEQFRWRFLLAAVAFPLIGADFFVNFKLVMDLASFNVRTPAGKLLQLQSLPVGSAFALLSVQAAAAGDVWRLSKSQALLLWLFTIPALHLQLYTFPALQHWLRRRWQQRWHQ